MITLAETNWTPEARPHLTQLLPGEYVQVELRRSGSGAAERVWLRVEDRLSGGRYRGSLSNHPRVLRELEYGAALIFAPQHILEILDDTTTLAAARGGAEYAPGARGLRA